MFGRKKTSLPERVAKGQTTRRDEIAKVSAPSKFAVKSLSDRELLAAFEAWTRSGMDSAQAALRMLKAEIDRRGLSTQKGS